MGTFSTTTALAIKMVGTTFDTPTTALAAACITEAENEIKKMLSNQFDMSSSYWATYATVPPMVVTLCTQYAEGLMYEANARGSKEAYARADRYIKRVMDNLSKLADGTLQLLDTSGNQITPTKTKWQVASNTDGYATTFNEDHPRRWKIDSTKLDDIAGERGESTIDESDEID